MNYIEPETLRYFFSTIAQSMAALFAVGGIFAIYRLQFIESQINSAINSYREFYRRIIISNALNLSVSLSYSVEQKKNIIEEATQRANEANEWLDKDVFYILLKHFQEQKENNGILDYCFYVLKVTEAKVKIVKKLKCPTALVALNFSLALIFLSIVDILCYCISTGLVFIMLFLTFLTILMVLSYVKVCFNLPKIVVFNNTFVDLEILKELRNDVRNKIKQELESHSQKELEYLKSEMEKFINNKLK